MCTLMQTPITQWLCSAQVCLCGGLQCYHCSIQGSAQQSALTVVYVPPLNTTTSHSWQSQIHSTRYVAEVLPWLQAQLRTICTHSTATHNRCHLPLPRPAPRPPLARPPLPLPLPVLDPLALAVLAPLALPPLFFLACIRKQFVI